MLKAVKGNKVYKIEETEKRKFLAQGYDIYGEDGEIVEHSAKSTVPYKQYAALETQNKKLEAELEELKKKNPSNENSEENSPEDEKPAKAKK